MIWLKKQAVFDVPLTLAKFVEGSDSFNRKQNGEKVSKVFATQWAVVPDKFEGDKPLVIGVVHYEEVWTPPTTLPKRK